MKQKIKEFNTWVERPLSPKIFFIMVSIIIGICTLGYMISCLYDTDIFFMIASGREILENGFIYENIWSIDKGCPMVIQQWLYNIILVGCYKWGNIGLFIFAIIRLCIFFGLLWHFLNFKKVSYGLRVISLVIFIFFTPYYVFSVRPELITVILLLTECICLEHFQLSGKKRWLFFLIPIMILEINLHASMWPTHFAILAVYVVPAIKVPFILKNDLWKERKWVFITAIFMIPAMWINPYGTDNVKYILKSFKAHTFDLVSITEMKQPTLLSFPGFVILLLMILFGIGLAKKCLHSTTVYICAGFLLMSMYAVRNEMFLIIAYLFLLRDISDLLKNINYDWEKDIKNSLIFVLGISILLLGHVGIQTLDTLFTGDIEDFTDMQTTKKIYDEIAKDYDEDTRIFAGFNNGSYGEFYGLKNIYMDARPELFTILKEYSDYCLYGHDINMKEMTKWFDGYDFNYVIVDTKNERVLNTYIQMRDDYHLIKSVSDEDTKLYKKGHE